MAKRTIFALLALPLFFAVIYFLPPVFMAVCVAALSVISVFELLWQTGIVREKRLIWVPVLSAVVIPFMFYYRIFEQYLIPLIFAVTLALFIIWIFNYKKIDHLKVTATFFAGTVIPVFFSMAIMIFRMGYNSWNYDGKYLILIPFIGAWMTDTGAYLTGKLFGKTKLMPELSPKKTVEGAIGGIIGSTLGMLVYGFIMERFLMPVVDYKALAIIGVVLSVIAQIGDLSMSAIKRAYGLKDYREVIPGHGGILDRFDSVLFCLPAGYILLEYLFVFPGFGL